MGKALALNPRCILVVSSQVALGKSLSREQNGPKRFSGDPLKISIGKCFWHLIGEMFCSAVRTEGTPESWYTRRHDDDMGQGSPSTAPQPSLPGQWVSATELTINLSAGWDPPKEGIVRAGFLASLALLAVWMWLWALTACGRADWLSEAEGGFISHVWSCGEARKRIEQWLHPRYERVPPAAVFPQNTDWWMGLSGEYRQPKKGRRDWNEGQLGATGSS